MNHIVNARLRGRTGLFTLRWDAGRISAIEAQADTLPRLQRTQAASMPPANW